MTPWCTHQTAQWICVGCLKCGSCCTCKVIVKAGKSDPEMVNRNSKAAEFRERVLRVAERDAVPQDTRSDSA